MKNKTKKIALVAPIAHSANSTRSTNYRYQLERSSKKHVCPSCNKRRFVRYVDAEGGNYLPIKYGRCDREDKCSYHLNPYKDGYNNKESYSGANYVKTKYDSINAKPSIHQSIKNNPVFIPYEILNVTLNGYKNNKFIQNLTSKVQYPFNIDDIEQVIAEYYLGTIENSYMKGAITFPFIDSNGNIRAIQVKSFDNNNKTNKTDFLHSIIEKEIKRKNQSLPDWLTAYQNNDKKVSCSFGEHLLTRYPNNPIALVEAPKTAIYGTLYFGFPGEDEDNLLWLAVYNKSSLTFDKLSSLKGKKVVVFPDLSKEGSTYKEWKSKIDKFKQHLPGTKFAFSDLLENLASDDDKQDGKDLADYLIELDWRKFRKYVEISENINSKPVDEEFKPDYPFLWELDTKPNWDHEISEFEEFFNSKNIIPKQVKLNSFSNIIEVKMFIKSHLTIVKANNGINTFLPYLNRLKKLKLILGTINKA